MVMITLYAGRFFTAVSPKKPKNTEVGSLFLLQGVFSTQESNQGLLHCRGILYLLSYQGNPMYLGLKPNFGPVLFFFSVSSRLSVKPLSQNCTEQAVQKHIADDTYPCLGNQASPPTRYMWSEWQGLQREGSRTHNLARKKVFRRHQPAPELFPVPGCQKKLHCLVSLHHGPQKKARLMFCHCSLMAAQAFKLNRSRRSSQKPSHRPYSERLSICFLSDPGNKFTLLYINNKNKKYIIPNN